MKVILIEPNKILNIGLSKYISEITNVKYSESFSNVKQFLSCYPDISSHSFEFLVVNIAYSDSIYGKQTLLAVNNLLTNKNIIVIHENKSKIKLLKNKKNHLIYFNIREKIKNLEALINPK